MGRHFGTQYTTNLGDNRKLAVWFRAESMGQWEPLPVASIVMALLPRHMAPLAYAGTTAVFFAAINAAKWLPYGLLGLLSSVPRESYE